MSALRATAAPLVRRWHRSPIPGGLGAWRQVTLLILVTVFVLCSTFIGSGVIFGAASLAAAGVLALWWRPRLGLLALIVLGAMHQTLMLLVFHLTHTPLIVKAAQSWKDVVVLVLLAKTISLALQRRQAPRLHLLDLLIIFFLAYGGFYLLYPSSVAETTIISKVFGLRTDAFFFLAYFIGRGFPMTRKLVRTLFVAFMAITAVIAVIAGLQIVSPGLTNAVFEMLSFSQFMEMQRGESEGIFAVRHNHIIGVQIPRASSLLLSDLALAFYTLLATPLAAALLFTFSRPRDKVICNLLFLATAATAVLTVTRSAMVAMAPAVGLVVLRGRAVIPALFVAAQAMAMVGIVTRALDIDPKVLQYMFSPNEASAQAHLQAFDASLAVLEQEPLGRGLGTAGQVAQRFAPQGGITNESWYLQIATEMGFPAAGLFLVILLLFGGVALFEYGRVNDPWLKSLCLGMAGATVGFAIVSMTLHAWEGLTTSIIFWLLAGIVVRAADLERQDEHADGGCDGGEGRTGRGGWVADGGTGAYRRLA